MRVQKKHWQALKTNDIYDINFHQFMELENERSNIEIAEEFGITLGEVKLLKKKINRS
ncbi:hypothetical protein ACLIBH_09245 [Virgibacillus sp. W0430]|uniref:hypothetical protein n=1 Tax=Virgibacillus sp. W0430 TaxID=3391580 RepID=UPI003F45AE42